MRGQPNPFWMGNSLAIKNPNIRSPTDLFGHFQKNRTFSKTQVSRYVGKIDPSNMPGLIHDGHIWEGENHHCRK